MKSFLIVLLPLFVAVLASAQGLDVVHGQVPA